MTRSFKALLVSAALFLPAAGAWPQESPSTQPITAAERAALTPSREMIEMGRTVATAACADCHGLDGVSTAAGKPNLAGQRTVFLHRVLQGYQSRERRSDSMAHASSFLNDDALLAVAAYYASLAPVPPAADTDEEPSGANGDGDPFLEIRDAMDKCVKCHGADGNASGSGMPNLTAQDPAYFVASMKLYAEGGRSHRLMQKLAGALDEQALAAMGVFYAVQEPITSDTVGDGDATRGEALAEPCATCHGADGNASGAEMPTLAGQDARYFIKAMNAYKSGSRQHEKMFEAVQNLDEAQVADLAAFYATQAPVRRNVRTPLTTSEWINRCERCHGIDGNSTDPRFPMLAGQDQAYLANALRGYAGTTRSNSIMHAMSDPLSQSDIARIARHYSKQTPKSVVYMQLPCEED